MCEEVRNLIDLTEWDEPNKETLFEEPEDMVAAGNFEGPYDPFDAMEKEVCLKGMTLKTQIKEKVCGAERQYPDLESESPPVCMQQGQDAAASSCSSSGEATHKRRLSSSFQKQLLKLNASRSVANTPPPPQNRSKSEFEKTILGENLQMLAAESPLKLIEDDDVMSSSINFEEDLRMLRIPILDALNQKAKDRDEEEPESNQDVGQLLQQLRLLVHEHVERTKWHLFDKAIAAIAAATDQKASHLPVPPSSYSLNRQGTFDLELQGTRTKRSFDASQVQEEEEETAAEEEILIPGSKAQNFPDAMVCSSATYDGESRADPFEKDLPIISMPAEPRKEPYMTQLVDETLALQINELLERHKPGQGQVDPRTVILLVNPSQLSSYPALPQATPMPLGDANAAAAGSAMRRRSSSLSIQDKSKLPGEVLKSNRQVENLPPPREAKSTATVGPMTAGGGGGAGASSFRQRSNSFSSQPTTKTYESRRTLMSSRLRTPSINESVAVAQKSNGNVKAMKPIKPVVPMMKVTTNNESSTYLNPVHPRVPDTPISSRTRTAGQKISCTSTPLPQMRTQQRRSLKPMGGMPGSVANASYSTPSFRGPSFAKKTGSG
ncbi:uncharacterized protein [Drosophila takahashii]|uniref:uncharacterized protein n=1 Tax=Drosophila takahashii TaxID=29030 RepID=UPI001CF8ACB0|nr:uncharacterized protein LOC108058439 [Drosophila takahashii]